MLLTRAPAKVNWTLEVLGRRPDGYHEIASVMSTVTLWDELILAPAADWTLTVEAPEPLRDEPATEDNLVARAAALFAVEAAKLRGQAAPDARPVWPPPAAYGPPARLHLVKRIPAAAGLGGGSSDAAAALRLLHAYWCHAYRRPPVVGWAPAPEAADQLHAYWRPPVVGSGPAGAYGVLPAALAPRLGSDVPFFLAGGTQLATGRGEVLRPYLRLSQQWLVILTPPLRLEGKTARLYGLLAPRHYTDGTRTHTLAERLERTRLGRTRALRDADLVNVFDQVADAAYPGIVAYRERLAAATGGQAHVCGAGPSLFALCPHKARAVAAAAELVREGYAAWAVLAPAAGHQISFEAPSLGRKGEVTSNP